MTKKLKIYVGYDTREDIAWQVARHSMLRHTAGAIEIYPLKQAELRELGLYTRGEDNATTEFSITRFLTPYLGAHDDWTIFVDCDFLISDDILKILDEVDPEKAVYVVQHEYTPANTIKMDGQKQTVYPRKNWSSFMLFNNSHPAVKALTPEVVNTKSPAYLHRFEWVDDDQIGALDLKWNFLEGEYPKPDKTPICVHYTNGGPWFDEWQDVDYAAEWVTEKDMYLTSVKQQSSAA